MESLLSRKGGTMINKILVATDGSSHAKKAVDFASDFASKYDATIYVVHVVQEERIPDEMKEFMEAEHLVASPGKAYRETIGKKIIEDAKSNMLQHDIKKIEPILLVGDAPREIVDFAKKQNIDVIILGNQGLGRVKEFFLGSVTTKVFYSAPCTCITVK
jgi:nucleotide-binding universal stress UspA family protein